MPVIKLRGLPWSCIPDDIVKFLNGIKILQKKFDTSTGIIEANDEENKMSGEIKPAIHLMTNSDGRPSGEAFVELEDEADLEVAMKRNNALMGQRYIEVFRSNYDQLNKHLEESVSNASNWQDPVVRLRGLPYGCVKGDISTFFDGLSIALDGIMMVIDFTGRFNGEAFVQFDTLLDALKALERHKQKISNRYIEVFRSTFDEMAYYANNSNMSRGSRDDSRSNRNRKSNKKSFMLSSSNSRHTSRSSSVNGFSNGRPKPYSRMDPRRGGGGGPGGNYDQPGENYFQQPRPLMAHGNNGSQDDRDDNYDNDDYENNNYDSSYVCENNHRHYLNFDRSNDKSNGKDYSYDEADFNRTGYGVRMRGLPYSATENEIREFFTPLNPTNVVILYTHDKRPSGECEVDFETHDEACEAMKYDKKYIGNRYIELFLLSGSMGSSSNGSSTSGSSKQAAYNSMISFGSLMNKDFSNNQIQRNNNNLNSLFTNFETYTPNPRGPNMTPPSQPPNPLMSVMSPNMTQDLVDSNVSSYSNINELIIADMAQKMFASALSRFHQQQQQQQHQPVPPPPPPVPPLNQSSMRSSNYQRRF